MADGREESPYGTLAASEAGDGSKQSEQPSPTPFNLRGRHPGYGHDEECHGDEARNERSPPHSSEAHAVQVELRGFSGQGKGARSGRSYKETDAIKENLLSPGAHSSPPGSLSAAVDTTGSGLSRPDPSEAKQGSGAGDLDTALADTRLHSATPSGLDSGSEPGPGTRSTDEVPSNRRHLAGFWICGLLNNYSYVVMLSAAESILDGHAGATLAADIIPTFLVKITAPVWTHRVPYWFRVWFSGFCLVSSFYLVALCDTTFLRLLGVGVGSIGAGWGEVTFLAITSHYNKNVVTSWSSGTGFAGIAGSAWFLVMHTLLDVSTKTTLLIGGFFPCFYGIAFTWLLAPHLPATVTSSKGYMDVDSVATGTRSTAASAAHTQASMTVADRFRSVAPLWIYMVPLFFVYFAEYLLNAGIHPTMSFDSMSKDTYYEWVSFLYQVGVFASRSSGTLFPLRTLWPLPVAQCSLVLFFLVVALTQFIPWPWPLFALVVIEGLFGGACYVNAFRMISENVAPELREFSLGAASVADTMGIITAALISLAAEPGINRYRRKHNVGPT